MPFIMNIDPVLFHLGPFEVRYYGLVYVIGFLLTYLWLRHLVRRKTLDMKIERAEDLILYVMLGALIGSRLLHAIFWEPSYYLVAPWKLLYVWEGGMSIHGGILGVAVSTYLFWRKSDIRSKVSFGRLADALSLPAILMFAIGRVANFINGELPGKPAGVSWCVIFPDYDDVCRHPQVLYSAAKRLLILAWLAFLYTKKGLKDGFICWNMMLLLGVGRFIIDFWREDANLLGLTAGQYLSIALAGIALFALMRYYKKEWKKVFS